MQLQIYIHSQDHDLSSASQMALPQHLEIVLRTIPIELRLCLSDSANPEIAWKLQLSCGHELGFLDAFAF